MSEIAYETKYPRGTLRAKGNRAIRKHLAGGDALLDASKWLADGVRSGGGRPYAAAALKLLDSAMLSMAASGSPELLIGRGLLERCQFALRDAIAGISDRNYGAAMALMDRALDALRDAGLDAEGIAHD